MTPSTAKRHSNLSQFESVARISTLPIVEGSIHIAGNVYDKIKHSNALVSWGLGTAEQSWAAALAAVIVFDKPISTIDQLLCRGLDLIEQRVPAVYLPPQHIYWNTREYVNNKIVRPVLMRAGSVQQLGSHAANAAADRLDGALSVADEYVDRYLPPDPAEKTIDEVDTAEAANRTVRTIQHGARFSRKLQKRLTRRTLAEARALKDQGTECIHVLLYVVELIATDPKLALQKARELWASLSLQEPENQARPASLEQLLVLLTRESARRIVHLVNGTSTLAAKMPRRLGRALNRLSHQLLGVADAVLNMTPIAGRSEVGKSRLSVLRAAILRLNSTATLFLEQLAAILAGRPKIEKTPHEQNRQQNYNNHMTIPSSNPSNGID